MIKRLFSISAIAALSLMTFSVAQADDMHEVELVIKDHHFTPDRIEVPAGKPFILEVKNQDDTAEEFESHDLDREKVVEAHGMIKLNIPALEPGEYKFVGEFHEDIAKGVIVVK